MHLHRVAPPRSALPFLNVWCVRVLCARVCDASLRGLCVFGQAVDNIQLLFEKLATCSDYGVSPTKRRARSFTEKRLNKLYYQVMCV